MNNFDCSLLLQKMVFDEIKFSRKGFKNAEELDFELQVRIGLREGGIYKVTLILEGTKPKEYDVQISLTGFFEIDFKGKLEDKMAQDLINKNAIAILMPYIRSELTLLTAQPETDSVVLPPFNINKMLENQNQ